MEIGTTRFAEKPRAPASTFQSENESSRSPSQIQPDRLPKSHVFKPSQTSLGSTQRNQQTSHSAPNPPHIYMTNNFNPLNSNHQSVPNHSSKSNRVIPKSTPSEFGTFGTNTQRKSQSTFQPSYHHVQSPSSKVPNISNMSGASTLPAGRNHFDYYISNNQSSNSGIHPPVIRYSGSSFRHVQ